MQQIIKGKLYDTKTARPVFGLKYYYKTEKGQYFYINECQGLILSEDSEIKHLLSRDLESYTKEFGAPEEG